MEHRENSCVQLEFREYLDSLKIPLVYDSQKIYKSNRVYTISEISIKKKREEILTNNQYLANVLMNLLKPKHTLNIKI